VPNVTFAVPMTGSLTVRSRALMIDTPLLPVVRALTNWPWALVRPTVGVKVSNVPRLELSRTRRPAANWLLLSRIVTVTVEEPLTGTLVGAAVIYDRLTAPPMISISPAAMSWPGLVDMNRRPPVPSAAAHALRAGDIRCRR